MRYHGKGLDVYVPGLHPVVLVRLVIAARRARRDDASLDAFVRACEAAGMRVTRVVTSSPK